MANLSLNVWSSSSNEWYGVGAQNVFSTIKIDNNIFFDANGMSDTLQVLGGDNISVLPDQTFTSVIITTKGIGDPNTLSTTNKEVVGSINEINTTLYNHTNDTIAHVTQADKDRWNASSGGTVTWNSIAETPTTIMGYGITDAATTNFVSDQINTLRTSLDPLANVKVATTENILLSGFQIIDGIQVLDNDRVLVKNQTNLIENGIYDVHSGAWVRSSDADTGNKLCFGTYLWVTSGGSNAATGWLMVTNNPITIGTSDINFYSMGETAGLESTSIAPTSPVDGQIWFRRKNVSA